MKVHITAILCIALHATVATAQSKDHRSNTTEGQHRPVTMDLAINDANELNRQETSKALDIVVHNRPHAFLNQIAICSDTAHILKASYRPKPAIHTWRQLRV